MSEEGEGEKDKQHVQWWNREFFETLTKEVADEPPRDSQRLQNLRGWSQ